MPCTSCVVGWVSRANRTWGGPQPGHCRSAFPGFQRTCDRYGRRRHGDSNTRQRARRAHSSHRAPGRAHGCHHAGYVVGLVGAKRRHWTTAPHYKSADQWRLAVPKVLRTGACGPVLAVVVPSLWITGTLLGPCGWVSCLTLVHHQSLSSPRFLAKPGRLASFWSAWSTWIALSLMWKRQDKRQW